MSLKPETAGILAPYLIFAGILGTVYVISVRLKSQKKKKKKTVTA